MSAYLVARVDVTDADQYAEDMKHTPRVVHQYGGRFIARGASPLTLEGEQDSLRNVIIESVNLGEIYRDQFQDSAREEDGDIDKVIANWTTVTVDVES